MGSQVQTCGCEMQWPWRTLGMLAALGQHSNGRVTSYAKDICVSLTHSLISPCLSLYPRHMPHMADVASQAQATVRRQEALNPLRLHVPLFPDPGLEHTLLYLLFPGKRNEEPCRPPLGVKGMLETSSF